MSDPNLHRALQQRLESLLAAGVRQLPRGQAPALDEPAAAPERAETPTEPNLLLTASPHAGVRPSDEDRELPPKSDPATATAPSRSGGDSGEGPARSVAATLEVLQQEVAGCARCPELATTRKQTVFGVGASDARLCFMGEAPGADEDNKGEPFVGRAGQLLNKIIQACQMQREDVYILNVLKCRPPGNRNPKPEEAANCSGFLDRQLELVNPEFICCLGAVAAQNLLGTQTAISRLRGQVHEYRGIKVVCTYHPAYLLRNPAAKKDAWEDMKMLMGLMGVQL